MATVFSQFPSFPRSSERGKIVSAREAVQLIRSGDTVATSGFVGIGFAEEIAIAIEQRFLEGAGDSDVAIVRGTKTDPTGNITMEKEALTLEALSIAMAAYNSGGIVIAQVERLADANTLNSRHVKIPGLMIDCVVVAKQENH